MDPITTIFGEGGGMDWVADVLYIAPSYKFMFFFKSRWEKSSDSTEFPNQNLRDLAPEVHGRD